MQKTRERVKVENMMLMNDVNVGIIGLFSHAMMHTYIHTSFQKIESENTFLQTLIQNCKLAHDT